MKLLGNPRIRYYPHAYTSNQINQSLIHQQRYLSLFTNKIYQPDDFEKIYTDIDIFKKFNKEDKNMKLVILIATGMVMGLLAGCASVYDSGCCPATTPGSYVTTYTTYPACGSCTTTFYTVDY